MTGIHPLPEPNVYVPCDKQKFGSYESNMYKVDESGRWVYIEAILATGRADRGSQAAELACMIESLMLWSEFCASYPTNKGDRRFMRGDIQGKTAGREIGIVR